MLFFPCPKCGGKVESAEDNTIRLGTVHTKHFAHGSMTGHAHPMFFWVAKAIAVGNLIYERCPGGGRKRCTGCGHEFS